MNKIEDIKSICKNPQIVQKGGMSITEIALALGVNYQQAKSSLETGLYKMGILLSPAAGAVLMSVSTVVVAINASLLKVK